MFEENKLGVMRDFSEMEIKKNDIEIGLVQLFSRKKLFAFALLAHLSPSTECLISFKVSPHRLSLEWVCDVWGVHMTSEGCWTHQLHLAPEADLQAGEKRAASQLSTGE